MQDQSKRSTHKTIEERFFSRITKTETCWLWTGPVDGFGYGRIGRGARALGVESTHRLAWQLANGPIPDGLWVLHRCDTPPCVNPSHLFLGTVTDNNRDMVKKGRHGSRTHIERWRRGEQHGRSKLTDDNVRVLRYYAANGMSQRAIASLFGLSRGTVSGIISGETWKHVEVAL